MIQQLILPKFDDNDEPYFNDAKDEGKILRYTLLKFDDNDEMYFTEEERKGK